MAKQIMADETLESLRTPVEVSRYLGQHSDQTLSQEQFDRVCQRFITCINTTIGDSSASIAAQEDVKLLRFLSAPHLLNLLSDEKLGKLYNSTLSSYHVTREMDTYLEQTYGADQAHLSPHYSMNVYERACQGGALSRGEMLDGLRLAIDVCEITPENVREMVSLQLERFGILVAVKEYVEGDYTILQRVGEREGLTLGGEYQHTIEHGIGTLRELSEEEVDVNALLQMENAATPPAAQGRGNWAERTGIGRDHGGRSF